MLHYTINNSILGNVSRNVYHRFELDAETFDLKMSESTCIDEITTMFKGGALYGAFFDDFFMDWRFAICYNSGTLKLKKSFILNTLRKQGFQDAHIHVRNTYGFVRIYFFQNYSTFIQKRQPETVAFFDANSFQKEY